jgi:GNAT superfamily N-acetyltransferase
MTQTSITSSTQRLASTAAEVAQPQDLAQIAALNQSLVALREQPNAHGFLLRVRPDQELAELQAQNLIWVQRQNTSITGYVIAAPWQASVMEATRAIADRIRWATEAPYSYAPGARTVYINEIGVDPAHWQTGVGKALYAAVAQQHPGADLIAACVERPIANTLSARFHTRLGFKRLGEFTAANFAGLDQYQSGIYLKLAQGN